MKKGSLVRIPNSSNPWLLGIIEDPTSRFKDGLVGIIWPNTNGEIKYEKFMWLEVVDIETS